MRYKIVGSGDERHLRAGTGIAAIKSRGHLNGYLCAYIRKLDQKIPPEGFEDVGRFWGSSRNLLVFETSKRVAQRAGREKLDSGISDKAALN